MIQNTRIISHVSAILLTVTVASLIIMPFNTQAIVPVLDSSVLAQVLKTLSELVIQTAQAIMQTAHQYSLVVKEYILDPAVKVLAGQLLQLLSQNIINWVQEGGNKNFVSSLGAALSGVADEAAGEFLNQLFKMNLCAPFKKNFKNIEKRTSPTIAKRLTCKASDILKNIGSSYEVFLGDFTQGGWLAYETMTLEGSDWVGVLMNTYDEKLKRESERPAVLKQQYEAGQGFLGVRVTQTVCDDFAEFADPICTTVDIQTTPGKLVVEQLAEVFNSGIQQAVAADEISEAINWIISALTNKLIDSARAGFAGNNPNTGINQAGLGNPTPAGPTTINASCSGSPSSIVLGAQATWTANVSGGTAPYAHSWSSGGQTASTGPAPAWSVTYGAAGNYSGFVTVTSADGQSLTQACAGLVTVN